MHQSGISMTRGTLASVATSVAFGGIFFLTPLLAPMSPESIWSIRNLITIPFIAFVLVAMRQWYLVTEIWYRIRKKPSLLLGALLAGTLLAGQLWMFGWGPLNGRGMEVALGYFLLPLVLVILGQFLYKDRLRWWHWLAAGVAGIGVSIQIVNVGGISWETVFVALGYPAYFVVRRAFKAAHIGGMFWEFAILSPVAVVVLLLELTRGTAFAENPTLWWFTPLFSLFTAFALWLYILASKLLPISIFGLLSYLEPALLVVASFLIGETIAPSEYPAYAAIWAAVLILLVGGIIELVRDRRRRGPRRTWPAWRTRPRRLRDPGD